METLYYQKNKQQNNPKPTKPTIKNTKPTKTQPTKKPPTFQVITIIMEQSRYNAL